jgi:hypothetical protein
MTVFVVTQLRWDVERLITGNGSSIFLYLGNRRGPTFSIVVIERGRLANDFLMAPKVLRRSEAKCRPHSNSGGNADNQKQHKPELTIHECNKGDSDRWLRSECNFQGRRFIDGRGVNHQLTTSAGRFSN